MFKNFMYSINSEMNNFNNQLLYNNNNDNNNSNFSSILSDTSTFECNSLDSFYIKIKKINRKFNKKFIPLFDDSIIFQLELIKNLENLKTDFETNLSSFHLKLLKKFNKEKPFKIVELDKNVGTAIISNENYLNISKSLLDDENTYLSLDYNPFEECINSYNNCIQRNFECNYISKKLYNSLYIHLIDFEKFKIGVFRPIPKIHKSKFSCRPIINYNNTITSYLCILLDCIIRPYIYESETFIKDSQDFINKTESVFLPKDTVLYSCDFESLYSNIPHIDVINMFSDFFRDKLDIIDIKIFAFREFLEFVLYNNYFKFNDKFYKQKLGIAMGSEAGPSIANLFVYLYEKKWLFIYKPLIYYRFIDDIFLALNNNNDIISLQNSFGSLKLNCIEGKNVNFLDLSINLNNNTNKLDFNLYFKPTNTFCYLHTSSNHPGHMFKNIVKSLLIRYRRICTHIYDFAFYSLDLMDKLVKRKYDKNLIFKIFTMVCFLDRKQLLIYKQKNNIILDKTILFKNVFDKCIKNSNQIIQKAFNSTITETNNLKDYKIKIINSMQLNLKSVLLFNFNFPSYSYCHYKKCEKNSCNVCKFANVNYYIQLKDNFILPFFNDSNCKSENVIYILSCKLCKMYYIGQSNNIYNRINTHISKIKNFTPFNNNNSNCVSNHFNLKFHNYKLHLNFFIIHTDMYNLKDRLNVEKFYIHLLNRLNINIINDFIPFIRNSYYLNNS